MSEHNTPAPAADQPQVEYRDIPDRPGYRVGSDGTVWTCIAQRGLGPGRGTQSYLSDKWRLMKLRRDRTGYSVVTLRTEARCSPFHVHRLVLLAFVGPCPPGMECCHENGVRTDCRLSNLRWDTPTANNRDRARHGTLPRGEKAGSSKLTEDEVREAKRLHQEGWPKRRIARHLGVSQRCVQFVLSGRNWGWLN